MSKTVWEVNDIAHEIHDMQYGFTLKECFELAIKIQKNRIFRDAYMVDEGDGVPVALEKIAMELESLQRIGGDS